MGSSWLVPVHGQRSRPSHHVREHGVEFYLADAVVRPITVTLRPSRGTVSLVSEVGAGGNHSAGSEDVWHLCPAKPSRLGRRVTHYVNPWASDGAGIAVRTRCCNGVDRSLESIYGDSGVL